MLALTVGCASMLLRLLAGCMGAKKAWQSPRLATAATTNVRTLILTVTRIDEHKRGRRVRKW